MKYTSYKLNDFYKDLEEVALSGNYTFLATITMPDGLRKRIIKKMKEESERILSYVDEMEKKGKLLDTGFTKVGALRLKKGAEVLKKQSL